MLLQSCFVNAKAESAFKERQEKAMVQLNHLSEETAAKEAELAKERRHLENCLHTLKLQRMLREQVPASAWLPVTVADASMFCCVVGGQQSDVMGTLLPDVAKFVQYHGKVRAFPGCWPSHAEPARFPLQLMRALHATVHSVPVSDATIDSKVAAVRAQASNERF